MAFRDAYKVSGKLVAYCIAENTTLEELSLDVFKSFSESFEEDVYDAIDLDNCVNRRTAYGGPSPESVKHQIELVREFINNH